MSYVSENVRRVMFEEKIQNQTLAAWWGIEPSAASRKTHGKVPINLDELVEFHNRTGRTYDELLRKGGAA